MVLTGTDPKRGKQGGDVHFKKRAAVFICLCTNRAKTRENVTFCYLSISFRVYGLHEIEHCA